MQTIAVVAQKGGVGKTSTAHAIGAGLARFKGCKVLFVDTDAQGNLSRTLEADTQQAGDVLDVMTGRLSAGEAIQHTAHGDIIAASAALSGADREAALNKVGREYRLKKALESIAAAYDYCIIDTPPALSTLTVNALTAASSVLIPAQADVYSLEALSSLRETIETVQAYCNPALKVEGILLTRYNGRAVLSRDVAEMMTKEAEALHTQVYSTQIRECTAVKEAQAMREDIFSYSPRCNASKDYKAIIDAITTGEGKQA